MSKEHRIWAEWADDALQAERQKLNDESALLSFKMSEIKTELMTRALEDHAKQRSVD